MNRRHLAIAAAAGAAVLALPSLALAQGERDSVAARVEAFRKAQIAGTSEALGVLVAPELSYSHSDGRVEDREKFLANASSGKSPFQALTYENPTIEVVGPNAIVRFHWLGEQKQASDGRIVATNLHILMVWQKRGSEWLLLARSATKL
ncbi:DUF4440 domain-containing protein [Xylophilus rhododendri]|uniref:DUF4440 domain-containing protein n=1 Tax=Xylophilus rhododendri TaxID=2697032 RepID=A0A857J3Y3_9BURK|nr:nuclear transport factor 2 family protein [Xylophilus rhododendri]QHI98486.1 DUF4440 domain-containing protein [Xylophilus rhododendri]